MAEAMATKIRVEKRSLKDCTNKRQCAVYNERKGMEYALYLLGINYEYEYNDNLEVIAVSVNNERVEL